MLPNIVNNLNIFSVINGGEPFVIREIVENTSEDIVLIAKDEISIDALYKQLVFLLADNEIDIVKLPSWDNRPYDRLSPSFRIQAQRYYALHNIITSTRRKIVILSVSGIAQKIIPPELIKKSVINIKLGSDITPQEIIQKLLEFGYKRADNACDFGEFSVRGSILDIIDNLSGKGIRIDSFGKKIDSIKEYDPSTQISSAKIDEFRFFPVSEVLLNQISRDNFLDKYKYLNPKYFNDPLYQSVKSDHSFIGLENWLPLFYEKLFPIYELFSNARYILDSSYEQNFEDLEKSIDENYKARINLSKNEGEDYFPVDPASIWLSKNESDQYLASRELVRFYAYNHPTEYNYQISRLESFVANAKINKTTSFQLLKKYRTDAKKLIIIACSSIGSIEIIKNHLFETGIAYIQVDGFDSEIIKAKSCVYLTLLSINTSFETERFAFISEQDLTYEKKQNKAKAIIDLEKIWDELSSFNIGDYVAHKTHGIGRFEGIVSINIAENNHDCLKLVYLGNDILYLPVENIDSLSRYKTADEVVKLDKLGNVAWQERKAKVKNRIKEIAIELLKIAAIRKTKQAPVFIPESNNYEDFCRGFPYAETTDQLASIEAVEKDLKAGIPMDRLVCGDVGFGKTEIALRAAFMVAQAEENPAQVAVIVPTTLLARQHYHNFKNRFENFPVNIKQISRLVTAKEIKQIKEDLKNGQVDIIIGTHALLAEEVNFGVKQKEKIKSLKTNCHVLTLSATPIPRTLQMSIVGIKDLSLIATPPVDRLAVKTYVMPYDSHIIREAILREYNRGGSIFYVAPRIEHLEELASSLKDLVPEVKMRIAHGQMPPANIEEIMMDFYNRKFEVLLSTTIIESGIDLPFVNTIVIHRADMFGLSALYQLRGRVGRSKTRAYAYLTTPKRKLTEHASARLEIMQTLDNLGAGFSIASNDMDLRGFGNLLGEEQSGQIKEVGLELYQSMLNEAILSLSQENIEKEASDDFNPTINLGIPVMIPDYYISDISSKLGIYRRAAKLSNYQDIDQFSVELIDRFGKFPQEVANFLLTLKIKSNCKRFNIEKIDVGEKAIVIAFRKNEFSNPQKLIEYISNNPGVIKIRPDQKIVLQRQFTKLDDRINYLSQFFVTLEELIRVY